MSKLIKFLSDLFLVMIPLTLVFDWLAEYEYIPSFIAISLKIVLIIICVRILMFKFKFILKFEYSIILIFYALINFIYTFLSDDVLNNFYFSTKIFFWVISSMTFYYVYKKEIINLDKIRLMLSSYIFIGSMLTIITMTNTDNHQTSNSYLLLWSIPMLLFLYNKKFPIVFFMLIISSIVITGKRGAIIALISLLIIFLLGAILSPAYKLKRRIQITISSVIILCFGLLIFYNNSEFLLNRFSDTTGSGRTIMYKGLVNGIQDFTIDEFVFGKGIGSVGEYNNHYFRSDRSISAHSDWLQLMFEFGFIGLLIMFAYQFLFIKNITYLFKKKSDLFMYYLLFYTVFFFVSIYSTVLSHSGAIIFGITLAVFSVEKEKFKSLELG